MGLWERACILGSDSALELLEQMLQICKAYAIPDTSHISLIEVPGRGMTTCRHHPDSFEAINHAFIEEVERKAVEENIDALVSLASSKLLVEESNSGVVGRSFCVLGMLLLSSGASISAALHETLIAEAEKDLHFAKESSLIGGYDRSVAIASRKQLVELLRGYEIAGGTRCIIDEGIGPECVRHLLDGHIPPAPIIISVGESIYESGTIVVIHGLTSKPELNGTIGRVKRFDVPRARYAVECAMDGVVVTTGLKPINVKPYHDAARTFTGEAFNVAKARIDERRQGHLLGPGVPKCDVCHKTAEEAGVSALKQCAKCKITWYCGRACQREDWRRSSLDAHKHVCRVIRQLRQDKARAGSSWNPVVVATT